MTVRRPRPPSPSGLGALAGGLVLAALWGPLCLLGLLAVGASGGVQLLLFATVGTAVAHAVRRLVQPGPWPDPLAVLAAGGTVTLLLLALTGFAELEGPLLPVAAATGLAAAPTAVWLYRRIRPTSSRAREPRLTEAGLADLVGLLPMDVLLEEWAASGAELSRRPARQQELDLVRLRGVLLDQLEERDAPGFAAWQRAAGHRPCSPAEFLGQRQEL